MGENWTDICCFHQIIRMSRCFKRYKHSSRNQTDTISVSAWTCLCVWHWSGRGCTRRGRNTWLAHTNIHNKYRIPEKYTFTNILQTSTTHTHTHNIFIVKKTKMAIVCDGGDAAATATAACRIKCQKSYINRTNFSIKFSYNCYTTAAIILVTINLIISQYMCNAFVLDGSQNSFARFRKWYTGLNGSLEFEFKTEQPNGLVLYTDDGGTYDFFEVKLVEGAVRLRYNLGGGANIVTVGRELHDGHWHKVQVSDGWIHGQFEGIDLFVFWQQFQINTALH